MSSKSLKITPKPPLILSFSKITDLVAEMQISSTGHVANPLPLRVKSVLSDVNLMKMFLQIQDAVNQHAQVLRMNLGKCDEEKKTFAPGSESGNTGETDSKDLKKWVKKEIIKMKGEIRKDTTIDRRISEIEKELKNFKKKKSPVDKLIERTKGFKYNPPKLTNKEIEEVKAVMLDDVKVNYAPEGPTSTGSHRSDSPETEASIASFSTSNPTSKPKSNPPEAPTKKPKEESTSLSPASKAILTALSSHLSSNSISLLKFLENASFEQLVKIKGEEMRLQLIGSNEFFELCEGIMSGVKVTQDCWCELEELLWLDKEYRNLLVVEKIQKVLKELGIAV